MNKAAVTPTVVSDHLVAIHCEGKRRDESCCSRLIVPGKSSAKAPRDHSMTPDNDSLNRKRFECSGRIEKLYIRTGPFTIYLTRWQKPCSYFGH